MSKQNGPQVGAPAPDFTLNDGDNGAWRLSDNRGQVVVLLFYPGDETPICTRQIAWLENAGRLAATGRRLRYFK